MILPDGTPLPTKVHQRPKVGNVRLNLNYGKKSERPLTRKLVSMIKSPFAGYVVAGAIAIGAVAFDASSKEVAMGNNYSIAQSEHPRYSNDFSGDMLNVNPSELSVSHDPVIYNLPDEFANFDDVTAQVNQMNSIDRSLTSVVEPAFASSDDSHVIYNRNEAEAFDSFQRFSLSAKDSKLASVTVSETASSTPVEIYSEYNELSFDDSYLTPIGSRTISGPLSTLDVSPFFATDFLTSSLYALSVSERPFAYQGVLSETGVSSSSGLLDLIASVEVNEFGSGDTPLSVSGSDWINDTYLFPDGSLVLGTDLNPNNVDVGTLAFSSDGSDLSRLISSYEGIFGSGDSPLEVAGSDWNDKSTIFVSPDGKITTGNNVNPNNVDIGTVVYDLEKSTGLGSGSSGLSPDW